MLLVGGPTATEAKLELVMRRKTGASLPGPTLSITLLVKSRKPEPFTPLKMKLARPSHKLSKLKAALIIVGEFLGIARRTVPPFTLKRSGRVGPPLSNALPGVMPRNLVRRTP